MCFLKNTHHKMSKKNATDREETSHLIRIAERLPPLSP